MSSQNQGHAPTKSTGSGAMVTFGLIAVFIIYLVLLAQKLPQQWTENVRPHETTAVEASAATEAQTVETQHEPSAEEAHEKPTPPPVWTITPFVVLLLCIAILPLIPATEHWWEHNSSRFLVAAGLGVITLGYYLFFHNFPVIQEWPVPHKMIDPAVNGKFAVASTVFMNAIIADFIPFIVLLFTLYTISGGIRIDGDLKAKPITNTVIIGIGAVLASIIGTTGAAMLLIRLLLETNKQRRIKVHTVIFFIFVVCNCGGCLTPLGDPPLFLGYLKDVKFEYTLSLWKEWLFVCGLLLVIYFLWDTFFGYAREAKEDIAHDNAETQPLKISGLFPNLFLLIGVVLSIMFLAPSKPIFGWYPWYFLREIVQLALVFISLTLGSRKIRADNNFNYAAIIEVAALFFGIFICMQAPLQILGVYGSKLGIESPMHFFWATGALSSFLDNAPTYVVFFETAKTLLDPAHAAEAIAHTGVAIDVTHLAAISLGAVFMGSMTYIGNGPNFMVKAIAEQSGVKMPSFFGYMVYSCLILLPLLVIMTFMFLR